MNNKLKQLIRELENAAFKCGEDEYRDGQSDAAVFRHADVLRTARQNLEDAIDSLMEPEL